MKFFKSDKRRKKGMTLIEVIISIAIVAVLSSVLVGTSKAINSYVKSARQTNERVAQQAPIAEAGYVQAAGRDIGSDVHIKLTSSEGEIVLDSQMYAVYSNTEMTDKEDEFSGNHNLKFFTDIKTTK